MKGMFRAVSLLVFILLFSIFAGCSSTLPPSASHPITLPAVSDNGEKQIALTATQQIAQALDAGQFEAIVSLMEPGLQRKVDAAQLQAGWESQGAPLGRVVSFGDSGAKKQKGYITVQLLCQHEQGQSVLTCTFNAQMLLSGIYIKAVSSQGLETTELSLPQGAMEKDVVLHQGSEMELPGKLVLPQGANASTPVVIFVQGSGSSDMDETIGPNKPFRDMAYGLAQGGIASLRYDKLPYAHPELFTQPDMTVELEYTVTLQEALRFLRETQELGPAYLAGHSLGGMLTPYLMEKSEGGFAGGILLAGSPRKLWEISYSQNLAILAGLPQEQQAQAQAQIQSELEKAQRLSTMTAEQALGTTIFGMPGAYLQHLEGIDAVALAKENGLPLLILQGEADFQVTMEEDFSAWQAALNDMGNLVSYHSYPGLSHLFMPAPQEASIQNVQEAYLQPGYVDEQVISDMVDWILSIQQQ